MAKIRVHELAKDLNMKNKELLAKLHDLGMELSSHMSTMEEAAAEGAKAHILGKVKTDVVEETRVKQTVIRRRRKIVKPEPVLEEAAAEGAPEEEEPAAAVAGTGAEEAAPEESIEEDAAAEAPEETPVEVLEEKPKAVPAETAAEKKAREKAKTTEEADAPAVAADDAGKAEMPEEVEAKAAPKSPRPEAVEEAKEPTPKPEKKKAARARKETPAKIIKLGKPPAEPLVAEEPPEAKAGREPAREAKVRPLRRPGRPAPDAAEPEAEAAGAAGKGRKRKRKADEDGEEKKFYKRRTPGRKKTVVEGDDLYTRDMRSRKGRRGARGRARTAAREQKTLITVPKAIKRRIKVDDTIVLSDLGKRMGIKASEMIAKLMSMGVMVTVNQTIDFDTAILVAAEFDYELDRAGFEEEEVLKPREEDRPGDLAPRPPVVTIMGHVDHGKTSLLDVIRRTNVTGIESGGITQHIGAYHVTFDRGQIVFLDTPGHEAFTSMRSRGASITDIVVLVVAADDGVMPQTIEAINHSKAAGVPIIVAINKIDKANADVDRVQRELADEGLMSEEWGGDNIFVKVSATQKEGIDELLEMILLQAEVLELKANPNTLSQGRVIEAKLDSGRGPIATVLVQKGTLHAGNTVVCGVHYGKVRAMLNDRGNRVDEAGPALPVEIVGLSGVPSAGDEMIALEDERRAKQVSMHRFQKQRSKELAQKSKVSLESLFDRMAEEELKELNIVLKADVQGSIEAITEALTKLSNEEVAIHIRHSATGTITESDIPLAHVSQAIIIGFNVRPSARVQALAEEEGVDIRFYTVIYDVIRDIKDAIVGMMASTFTEQMLGNAEVLEVFHIPRVGAIAGSRVMDGKVERGLNARLVRDGVVRYDGKINSLRRLKDDVREVQKGVECGIGLENYADIKQGDVIECFSVEEIRPVLE